MFEYAKNRRIVGRKDRRVDRSNGGEVSRVKGLE